MSDSGSRTRIYQPTLQARTIAALNDELRRDHRKGVVAVTRGVLELGRGQLLPAVMAMVAAYDNFTEDNDPYGEHDFGALSYRGCNSQSSTTCFGRLTITTAI